MGRADDGAMQAGEGDGSAAAGQADAIDDLGNGADLRVLVLVLRDEQDAIFVADVDRQGDGHAREHDGVLERDEQQVTQDSHSPIGVLGIRIVPAPLEATEERPGGPDERLERHARGALRERLLRQERHVDEAADRPEGAPLSRPMST